MIATRLLLSRLALVQNRASVEAPRVSYCQICGQTFIAGETRKLIQSGFGEVVLVVVKRHGKRLKRRCTGRQFRFSPLSPVSLGVRHLEEIWNLT